MQSRYHYQFTHEAARDLDGIVAYITNELGNPTAAANFVSELEDAIDLIRLLPESSPLVTNEFLSRTDVRKRLVKNYIMYYVPDVATRTITILRIVYGRRDLNSILAELDI